MASKWNKGWRESVQPRKQRAYVREAPPHTRGRFLSAHLSKELRQKYKCRSLRLRAGDKVKIMRGLFRNKTGKIDRIDVKKQKVYITGIESTKRDGSKAMRPIHPSNILLQEPDLSDKRRLGGTKQ